MRCMMRCTIVNCTLKEMRQDVDAFVIHLSANNKFQTLALFLSSSLETPDSKILIVNENENEVIIIIEPLSHPKH